MSLRAVVIASAAAGICLLPSVFSFGASVSQEEQAGSSAVARTEQVDQDGNRVIQVIEHDRMIRISERNLGVTVTVVETVRGVDKATRYFARSAEQLRNKEPKAFEIYQAYREAASGEETAGAASQEEVEAVRRRAETILQARLAALQQQYAANAQMMQLLTALQRRQSKNTVATGGGPGLAGAGAQAQARARARAYAAARASASGPQRGSTQRLHRRRTRRRRFGVRPAGIHPVRLDACSYMFLVRERDAKCRLLWSFTIADPTDAARPTR